jgi:hypothetical protein
MYNTIFPVKYQTDEEYRSCICRIFSDADADADTDEAPLNENTQDKILDFVYNKTHLLPLFRELYEFSAAKIFSRDLDLGMALLFSFDYFDLFHHCLVLFLETDNITENDECYINLRTKLYV